MSGPPAAGKTTSARPLANALGYPLLCMDDVKELMAEAIGPSASEFADELGDAAVRHLIASASELLHNGVNVIVEGFFQSDRYSSEFTHLTAISNTILIHLLADDAVLKHRYEQRAINGVRHWIHGDQEKLGTLQPELPAYMAERLHLQVPQLVVDTTHEPMNIEATAQLIQQSLQSHVSGKSV